MTDNKQPYFYKTPDVTPPSVLRVILSRFFKLLLFLLLLGTIALLLFRRSYPSEVPFTQRIVNNYYVLLSDLVSIWEKREVVPSSDMPKQGLTAWIDFNLQNYLKFSNLISVKAYAFKVDPDLVRAIIVVCSKFDPEWTGTDESRGLMCLRVSSLKDPDLTNPLDPEQNISSGSKYLSTLSLKHSNDLVKILSDYYLEMRRHESEDPAQLAEKQKAFVERTLKAYTLIQGRQ